VSGAGTTERRRSRAVAAFARSPLGRKLSRYTIGSVVATAIGQGAFFVLYAIGVDGSVAAVVGYLAGFVPNYVLNRVWAWQRTDRPSLTGEILPYAAVIASSAAASAWLTAVAERGVEALGVARPVEVALVTVAFWGITILLFLVKFVVFDRYLFGRSRG